MFKSLGMVLGFGFVALSIGCAEPPRQEIEAVKVALGEARDAGASDYAPNALKTAEEAEAAFQAELDAQAGKSGPMRRYKVALEKAAAAKDAARAAAMEAVAAKEQARSEATEALAAARSALVETRALLANMPEQKPKKTQVDRAALGTDLDAAEQAIREADDLFAAASYREASAKAKGASSSILSVKSRAEAATTATGRA
jgi:hypothetical protein